jgi:hypothetical protein
MKIVLSCPRDSVGNTEINGALQRPLRRSYACEGVVLPPSSCRHDQLQRPEPVHPSSLLKQAVFTDCLATASWRTAGPTQGKGLPLEVWKYP